MKDKIKKIAVIGATGNAGKAVIKEALDKGYNVVAIVRTPQKLLPQMGLEIVKGDVRDVEGLILALQNVDAVISCLGPTQNFKPEKIMSEGTKNILNACISTDVKRFIMMSGILQPDRSELSFFNKIMVGIFQTIYKDVVSDKIIAEQAVLHSNLNWVIVRFARLKNLQSIGTYTAGPQARISILKPLPITDCAKCLVRALKEELWTGKVVNAGI
jgi:putative NADH-flavin reductase